MRWQDLLPADNAHDRFANKNMVIEYHTYNQQEDNQERAIHNGAPVAPCKGDIHNRVGREKLVGMQGIHINGINLDRQALGGIFPTIHLHLKRRQIV